MENFNFTSHVLAIIDILGQSSKLEKFPMIPMPSSPDYDIVKEQFIQTSKGTIGTVVHFRERVNVLKGILLENRVTDDMLKLLNTESGKDLYKRMNEFQVNILFCSDLAQLDIDLADADPALQVNSVHLLLSHLSILCINQLAVESPVRGGIDIGSCTRLENNDLYGQAVSRAYRLESEVAAWPRIVLGNSFLEYLSSFNSIRPDTAENQVILSILSQINNLIEKDIDGKYILSYLSPAMLIFLEYKAYRVGQGVCAPLPP